MIDDVHGAYNNFYGKSHFEEPTDDINHPEHYNTGNIETFDYICDSLSGEELRGYIKGNVLKYVSRERHKGELNDLRKAQWYLKKYIDMKDCVNIAEKSGHQNTKPTDKCGTHVKEQVKQEKIYEEKNKKSTTTQNEFVKRCNPFHRFLMDAINLTEKEETEDILNQQEEPKCTCANHDCRPLVGVIV